VDTQHALSRSGRVPGGFLGLLLETADRAQFPSASAQELLSQAARFSFNYNRNRMSAEIGATEMLAGVAVHRRMSASASRARCESH
jgi:hypothetical protein